MRADPFDVDLDSEPWRAAAGIVRRLQAEGHAAVFVGGCVRDLLLGRAVKDIDVATDADPEAIVSYFPGSLEVGKRFGVIVVPIGGGRFVEVASFRSDEAYVDGRHPVGVHLASEGEDVQRRDFTINALVLDPRAHELRDHVGGLADLERRILRVVGDPQARLREDRLRVLRGLRFAAQLGFEIEPATWAALGAVPVAGLSRERVLEEWDKALAGAGRARWWALLRRSGRLGVLCEAFAAAAPERLDRVAVALGGLDEGIAGEPDVALACCLAAAPEGFAAWSRSQPFSRARRTRLLWLLEHLERECWTRAPRPQRRRLLRHPDALQLLALWRAWHPDWPAHEAIAAAQAAEQSCSWRPLLSAAELLALGFAPGPRLGEVLRDLEDAELDERVGDRAQALALARELMGD